VSRNTPVATLTFDAQGTVRGLYTEAIDLHRIGLLHIERATSIEFDNDRQAWRVRDTTGFPLFSAPTREQCLDWERLHLDHTAAQQAQEGAPEPVSFIAYLSAVDALLTDRYGITSHDVDTEAIVRARDDGWTPEACVQWLGGKYDLIATNRTNGGTHA
jgi:hypothetical protein